MFLLTSSEDSCARCLLLEDVFSRLRNLDCYHHVVHVLECFISSTSASTFSTSPEIRRMPLYTAITHEDTVSSEIKAKIAGEITRIHVCVMKVPKNFICAVYLRIRRELALPVGLRLLPLRSIAFCGATTPSKRNRHAEADLGDASRSHRDCNGSVRSFSSSSVT